MRLTHKEKAKIARKLRTYKELIERVPIFQTKAWEARVERIKRKVKKHEKEKNG